MLGDMANAYGGWSPVHVVMRIGSEVDDGRDNAKYSTEMGAESLGITRENEDCTSIKVNLDPRV